jgi:hypothetical protein
MIGELIPVSEAARAEGVTRQTLHRQLRQGAFPHYETADGLRVRLSEVRAGRRANLDPARAMHQRRARASRQRAGAPRPLVRQPATDDEPRVNVYGEAGTVLTGVAVSDLLAEYGGDWDALERHAEASDGYIRVPLVRPSELHACLAKVTADALANTPGDRIYLDHLEVTTSRADAGMLLAVYRCDAGEADFALIRQIHAHLRLKAED